MKTTIITFVTYAAIFLLVGALLYFFAFWRPNANRVYQLNLDIAAAHTDLAAAAQMNERRPQLEYDLSRQRHELYQARGEWERVSQEWDHGYRRFLPDFFNEVDIMDRAIRIVEPHSHNLNVNIQQSTPLMTPSHNGGYTSAEGLWLTPVHITFTAGYEGLIAIFNDFAHAGIDNRIVDFSLNRQNNWWDVTARIDVLSLAPQPDGDSNGFNLHPPAAGDEYGQQGNNYEYTPPEYGYGYQPYHPYYPYDDGHGYYPPQDYYVPPPDPADYHYDTHTSGLVGTWLIEGIPLYVFEPDGSGTWIGGHIIRWTVRDGMLSICMTPDVCSIDICQAPILFDFALEGDQLTIMMYGEAIVHTQQ